MRLLILCFSLMVLASCHVNYNKTVKGNGNIVTQSRSVDKITRLKIQGGIDVALQPGSSSVKVEADENLQNYIETKTENGWLVITTKHNVNIKSDHSIKVFVSADMIDAIKILGSGNVTANGKFSGGEKLDIDIAGSGEVNIEVNTPNVDVDITGSGNVKLRGETRDAMINMKGSGNYDGGNLLTENTEVSILGSGDATVHADVSLDAEVRGSGSIYYKGKAAVKKHKSGSGSIDKID